jgi:hypothetical protein
MKTEIIKNHMGRFVGTSKVDGTRKIVRDFATGRIISSYDFKSNKTIDWRKNQTLSGDQAIRFLK